MRNTDNEIDSERVSPEQSSQPDIDIESLADDENKASASPSSVQKQRRRIDKKPKTKKSFKENVWT